VRRSSRAEAKRQLRGKDTARVILDATTRVLDAGGEPLVTIARVAAEAGVSAGTLYHHYSSRDDLMGAWQVQMLRGMADELLVLVRETLTGASARDDAFAMAYRLVDTGARRSVRYKFEFGHHFSLARPAERIELANLAASFLATGLAVRQDEIYPTEFAVAARMLVEAVPVLAWDWAPAHPDLVTTGAFQREVATMMARYAAKDPGGGPFVPPTSTSMAEAFAPPATESSRALREPRKAPSQVRSEETIAVLLQATGNLLTREGIDAATTTRIAAEAGVSVGTLYQYYPTRDALVAAWEEGRLSAAFAAVTDIIGTIPKAGEPLGAAGFSAIVEQMVTALVAHAPPYCSLLSDYTFRARPSVRFALVRRAARALAEAMSPRGDEWFPEDLSAATTIAMETAFQLSFTWANDHRDACASGVFQRELASMLTRYFVRDLRSQRP
jgi:AcrR family transcriptional regulator